MADEKQKFQSKNKDSEKISEPKSKAELIIESKMPEAQKLEYLKQIGAIAEESESDKIPFLVYSKIKKIPVSLHNAMLAYPKAKGVKAATFQVWEEIFKSF